MGNLRAFSLPLFDCNIFFETGTGSGASLQYAYQYHNFKWLYSVEIHSQTALAAAERFGKATNVTIINSDSASALENYLPRISVDDRILFFLDAHFPGEESTDFKGYKAAEPRELKLPLANELKIIKNLRPNCRDVITIDDLRIYEYGPFESGNVPDSVESLTAQEKSIGFVYDIFPERTILWDYRNEGYLIILNPT